MTHTVVLIRETYTPRDVKELLEMIAKHHKIDLKAEIPGEVNKNGKEI